MKTVLYLAMSVNGMIAGENDETPWSKIEWDAYVKAVEGAGNLILGHRTYDIMKHDKSFDSFMVKPFCVVLSHTQIASEAVMTLADPVEAVEAVRQKGFSRALIGGGREVATEFLQAGLVDEIELDVEPMIMAKGIGMVSELGLGVTLELKEAKPIGQGVVHLSYAVKKGAQQ